MCKSAKQVYNSGLKVLLNTLFKCDISQHGKNVNNIEAVEGNVGGIMETLW